VRAHGEVAEARVIGDAIEWLAPHPRVAPGQAVVFYDGERVLGGATAA
jgi:tRNA U34 2-thiouridine synthase MnmA/TrmU